MTYDHDIDDAVDHVMSHGMAEASEADILRQLDAELQQQTQALALVSTAEEPMPWVMGGEQSGGFGSMAQRFLGYYSAALRRELCEPGAGPKEAYRTPQDGPPTRERVKALAPAVLAAIGAAGALINPAVIAAIVAVWLLRLGLERWCAALAPQAVG